MKPTPDELVKRVEALEAAVTQMFGALKADLAALRADLVLLKDGDQGPVRRPSASQQRAPSGSMASQPQRKTSSPSHTISEETLATKKKDPRSDE